MNKLTSVIVCRSCGGLLLSPQNASDIAVPPGTDYVCLKCSTPYRWDGDPPRLTSAPIVAPDIDDDR